jgi:hypothetical protein
VRIAPTAECHSCTRAVEKRIPIPINESKAHGLREVTQESIQFLSHGGLFNTVSGRVPPWPNCVPPPQPIVPGAHDSHPQNGYMLRFPGTLSVIDFDSVWSKI